MSVLSSSHLHDSIILNYQNFSKLKEEKVKGYKVVREYNLNYYSAITGLYRYKVGRVDSVSNYHKLYQGTEYYREEMVGKIAIFKDINDAEKLLEHMIKIDGDNEKFKILEIELSGNLLNCEIINDFMGPCDMYCGTTIKNII